MRRYAAFGVTVFALLLVVIGCPSTPPPSPAAGQSSAAAPVAAPAAAQAGQSKSVDVDILVSEEYVDGHHIQGSDTTLHFKTLDQEKGAYTLRFPTDPKYPPACKDEAGQEFQVTYDKPHDCTVNPLAASGPVYYKLDPPKKGGTPAPAPAKKDKPVNYSVIPCKGCS